MGIEFRDLKSVDALLEQQWSTWERNYGDGDGILETSDFLMPRGAYTEEQVAPLLNQLEKLSGQNWNSRGPSIFNNEIFLTYATQCLGQIFHKSARVMMEDLKVIPDGAVTMGSSVDMSVSAFTVPGLVGEDPSQASPPVQYSTPFIFLGLFGISSSSIGIRGHEKNMPGDVAGVLEGKRTYLALWEGMVMNPQIHLHADSPYQVINIPGMLSTHANVSLQDLQDQGAPGTILYSGRLEAQESHLGLALHTLKENQRHGKTSAIIADSLGENDLLVWKGPHRISPETFRQSLEERITSLKNHSPGAVIVRSGLLPAHLIYEPIPLGHSAHLITGKGALGYEIKRLAPGSMAFKPVVDQIVDGGYVFEGDIFTPEEFEAYTNYIHELQDIEREVCAKHNVVLVSIPDNYLEKIKTAGFFWEDGVHPRAQLTTLLALMRALEAKKILKFNPTSEALKAVYGTLGVSEQAVREAFEQETMEASLAHIYLNIPENYLSSPAPDKSDPFVEEKREKAALLFSLLFNTSGRTRKMINLVPYIGTTVSSPIHLQEGSLQLAPDWMLTMGATLQTPYAPFLDVPIWGTLLASAEASLETDYSVRDKDLTLRAKIGGSMMNRYGVKFGEAATEFSYSPVQQDLQGRIFVRGGLGYDPTALGPKDGLGFNLFWEAGYRFYPHSGFLFQGGLELKYRF